VILSLRVQLVERLKWQDEATDTISSIDHNGEEGLAIKRFTGISK
jgi:hypothetical protein